MLLGLLTGIAYFQVLGHGFVNLDDRVYVSENPMVLEGLSPAGTLWAFTTFASANWHPLTWLSLQLDAQLFGVDGAWGFHLHNVLLHLANVLLLYFLLCYTTAARWRSLLVAALFAVHPLHVESVAWVTERKDVLAAFFWLWTMAAWSWYATRPSVPRYVLVLACFILSLLAKPMAVTLPLVLWLWDVWPLQRVQATPSGRIRLMSFLRLFWEKVPLLLIAGVSIVTTLMAQEQGGAIGSLYQYPLSVRIANAVVAYAWYVGKTFWPTNLAAFYPHPGDSLAGGEVAAAAALLLGLSALILALARRQPVLLVGWLWFLGTLVPVIGLVQVGAQGMADRYTYIPHIGLFVALVWGADALLGRFERASFARFALSGTAVLVLLGMTMVQVSYWGDSFTLFTHALDVTGANAMAQSSLAIDCYDRGKLSQAEEHVRAALALDPNSARDHSMLGVILSRRQDLEGAAHHFRETLRIDPSTAKTYFNLGVVLLQQRQWQEGADYLEQYLKKKPVRDKSDAAVLYQVAIAAQNLGQYSRADDALRQTVELQPDEAAYLHQRGITLYRLGDFPAAYAHLSRAADLDAKQVFHHTYLALVCQRLGESEQAKTAFRAAFTLSPHWPEQACALAQQQALARHPTPGELAQAWELAEQACAATDHQDARWLEVLALVHAARGAFDEAEQIATRALALTNDDSLKRRLRDRLALYAKKQLK